MVRTRARTPPVNTRTCVCVSVVVTLAGVPLSLHVNDGVFLNYVDVRIRVDSYERFLAVCLVRALNTCCVCLCMCKYARVFVYYLYVYHFLARHSC